MEEAKTIEYMLSTSDNPFNPFTNFREWFAFDEGKGYHTCSYLARISNSDGELGEKEDILATNLAIEEILHYNLTGNYIKVPKPENL